ncbi:hypothetical protein LEP1GSC133_1652 [Leptospira borgpetersenii serovar Pomona str. 200901868]|uniref:Uncharacterized protein n=1 Tax=Leptospira borgpetersenii serovar Pomona str. 200901868 TaxID=1192866 RepID=M6W0A6_LEPBO|nr:hypothetical protein LEP1GSC133_1652 [Leptospira borgpetersenii serovar Pomona str. 200901868]
MEKNNNRTVEKKIYKSDRKRGSCIKSEREKDSRQRKEICGLCRREPDKFELKGNELVQRFDL